MCKLSHSFSVIFLILSSDCCPALTSIKLPWMTPKIFLTLFRVEGKQGQCTAGFLLAVPKWEKEAWVKAGGGSWYGEQPTSPWDTLKRKTRGIPTTQKLFCGSSHKHTVLEWLPHGRPSQRSLDLYEPFQEALKTTAPGFVKSAVANPEGFVDHRSLGTRKIPHRPEGEDSINTSPKEYRTTQDYSIMLLFLYHEKWSFYPEV